MIEYSLVVGVDRVHFKQLQLVWPTWAKFKPSLLQVPMIVFYDRFQVNPDHIRKSINHPNLILIDWPPHGVFFKGSTTDKWNNPQRYRMLSGFVHVPAMVVTTEYWLKLDTDVVATGNDDWIDPRWFEGSPAIVSHRWGFTKPPQQMVMLDEWVEQNRDSLPLLTKYPPLDLIPEEGRDRVCHPRIISWCGFFSTTLTRIASTAATQTCGEGLLPVPSQDGYLWYIASRMQHPIVRTIMKNRGFEWWSSSKNVEAAVKRVLNG